MPATHASTSFPVAHDGRMPIMDKDEVYAGSDLTETEIAIARKLVLEKPSPSYLQRRMQIPYSHAIRLMEYFEAAQIVSKPNSAGLRKLLLEPEKTPSPKG
jgi:DNA segregation ATPase FtsK/SpoIIIE-like protein